jgi:O-acetyl-ADP-ribose deacetylase (regulator of RNase III)
MIKKDGDVFTTRATYIGHGVNCYGVMGAGIAKTVRDKFPRVYDEYRQVCQNSRLKPGDFFVYPENGKVIVNLATQNKPGPDATYEAVFNSLAGFSKGASSPKRLRKNGNVIAIPQIGAGIGGLDWSIVESIIEVVEKMYPEIEYEVWTYGN